MPKIFNFDEKICLKNLINLKSNINKNIIKGIKFNLKNNEFYNIQKNIIGFIKNNDNILFIDKQNTYIKADLDISKFIEIKGNHQLWYKYYPELNKISSKVFKKIKKVHIHKCYIDLILEKNITIKLYKSIQNLNDFFNDFPEMLDKENAVIDLQDTKKVSLN